MVDAGSIGAALFGRSLDLKGQRMKFGAEHPLYRKAIVVLLAIAPCAARAGETGPGTIYDLQVDGNRVVFGVTGSSTGKPACAIWSRYVFDVTQANGPAMLAYLLTKQAMNHLVRVYGTNACSIAPDHETASGLRDG